MAQSTRAIGRGQSRGKNVRVGFFSSPPTPSLFFFHSASALSTVNGAVNAANNLDFAKQQAQEKKYSLWKYVTRN